MNKLSTVGTLTDMLDRHHAAQVAVRVANEEAIQRKWQLCQYAIDNNMLDCLTVNVSKLEKYA